MSDDSKASIPETPAKNGNGYIVATNTLNLTVSRLSKLQRWILEHAHQNRLAEHRDGGSRGADLYYAEVLAGFYGFAPVLPVNPDMGTTVRTCCHLCGPGSKRFDPDIIGRARYSAACASLSRAVTRLEYRKLVTVLHGACSHWAGVSLIEGEQPGDTGRKC